MDIVTRTEEMLLVAVCRLAEEAFGLNIRKEMEAMTGKRYSIGGVYVPLDRLVSRGLLETETESGSGDRLGRPRKRFVITSAGLAALADVHELQRDVWSRIPEPVMRRLNRA
jgi:PadR family transcriptional regulator PadR